jgi:hypothetical protein
MDLSLLVARRAMPRAHLVPERAPGWGQWLPVALNG